MLGFLAFLLLLATPVWIVSSIILLVKKIQKKDTQRAKITFIVSLVLSIVLCFAIGMSGSSDSKSKKKAETPVQTNTPVETAPTVPVQQPVVAQTEYPVESESITPPAPVESTPVVSESPMDILTRPGHPTYYGSLDQAREIWGDLDKDVVLIDRDYKDGALMLLDGYLGEDTIHTVELYFGNFGTPVSFEEAAPFIAEYLPDDMDQYYTFMSSEKIVPDEGVDKDTYYVVSYSLTGSGEHSYTGSLDVIMQESDGSMQTTSIRFGTPRWMSSLHTNSYHIEDWSCDLCNYR